MSAWRVNDTMRESHTMLTHLLVLAQRNATDQTGIDASIAERREWREGMLAVDGYNREAVDAYAALIDARVKELRQRIA